MDCLQTSIRDIYAPQNAEPSYHGRRFKAWKFQVDLQLSPQWENNFEDMYEYFTQLPNPKRRRL